MTEAPRGRDEPRAVDFDIRSPNRNCLGRLGDQELPVNLTLVAAVSCLRRRRWSISSVRPVVGTSDRTGRYTYQNTRPCSSGT